MQHSQMKLSAEIHIRRSSVLPTWSRSEDFEEIGLSEFRMEMG
jgi:hypothetical protein